MVNILTACASDPIGVVYKQGTLLSERQAAMDACKIASFKEIPQNVVTSIDPGYSSPGSVNCTTIGYTTTCNRIGAIDIPASSSQRDVNEDMRIRYVVACLRRQGYAGILRKECGAYEKTYGPNDPQPPKSTIKCVREEAKY